LAVTRLSSEAAGMRTRRSRPAPGPRPALAGFRFPPDVIVLAIRRYLRFGLSYRDVEELLTERGIEVDHVTVHRWVQRFTPLLAEVARPCRHGVGDRWYVDEIYVKVAGRWRYVYRAIDQFGQVIDVLVPKHRDVKAARRFFERAIDTTKATLVRVVTDRAPVCRCTRWCWRNCCRRPGIALTGRRGTSEPAADRRVRRTRPGRLILYIERCFSAPRPD
jgi:transposase-like protein